MYSYLIVNRHEAKPLKIVRVLHAAREVQSIFGIVAGWTVAKGSGEGAARSGREQGVSVRAGPRFGLLVMTIFWMHRADPGDGGCLQYVGVLDHAEAHEIGIRIALGSADAYGGDITADDDGGNALRSATNRWWRFGVEFEVSGDISTTAITMR